MKRYTLCFITLVGLLSGLLLRPTPVAAHSLDQFLQASYLTLGAKQVDLELDLTPGLMVAPQVLQSLDSDGNQQISESEGRAYAETLLQNISLEIDGQVYTLRLTSLELPTFLNLQAGYGTLKVFAQTDALPTTTNTHRLFYKNSNQLTGSVWQVNAFVEDGAAFSLGPQNRDDLQQTLTVAYAPAGVAVTVPPSAASPTATPSSAQPAQLAQVVGVLYQPELSLWLVLSALGLAFLLGGLHALTPGHGKTLVAAYLVGSRGTVRHAVTLGGIVTFTHTISVILAGVVALAASRFIVPGVLTPTLEILSGALVVGLGLRLLWTRRQPTAHGHNHSHSHSAAAGQSVKFGELLTMGVSGGLVPCPEALGILLIAVGLNRIELGLALIVAFSLGVAAVLITLGLVLVRSRALLEKASKHGKRWQNWLPLVSAGLVTLLGLGIVWQGLLSLGLKQELLALLGWGLGIGGLLFLLGYRAGQKNHPPHLVEKSTAPRAVSTAPMSAAPLRFKSDGQVAWDEMWTDFCALALAGGPPHRGTLLEPVVLEQIQADPVGYQRAVAELERGLRLVSDLEVVTETAPGWIGLVCRDDAMALWLLQAIIVENVSVRREGQLIFLPVGPRFRTEKEIKNVITVVAKTYHYWSEHQAEAASLLLAR